MYYVATKVQDLDVLRNVGAKNVLMSFWYCRGSPLSPQLAKEMGFKRVFLDSGAHTLYQVSLEEQYKFQEEYIKFIKSQLNYLDVYVTLDRINNFDKTYEVWKYFVNEAQLPKCMPVLTGSAGKNSTMVHEYAKYNDYLGVSCTMNRAYTKREFWEWFRYFKMLAPYKYHGFAQTAFESILSGIWYSVDSSSWVTSDRYGKLFYYDSRMRKVEEINVGTTERGWQESLIKLRYAIRMFPDIFEKYGIREPRDIVGVRTDKKKAALRILPSIQLEILYKPIFKRGKIFEETFEF